MHPTNPRNNIIRSIYKNIIIVRKFFINIKSDNAFMYISEFIIKFSIIIFLKFYYC